jgi:hypothetical protein
VHERGAGGESDRTHAVTRRLDRLLVRLLVRDCSRYLLARNASLDRALVLANSIRNFPIQLLRPADVAREQLQLFSLFSSDKLVKMFAKMFVLVSETRGTLSAPSGRAFH